MTRHKYPKIIEVVVPLRVDSTFHYSVPPELAPLAVIGTRVLVPFGRRKLTGYVIGAVSETCEEVQGYHLNPRPGAALHPPGAGISALDCRLLSSPPGRSHKGRSPRRDQCHEQHQENHGCGRFGADRGDPPRGKTNQDRALLPGCGPPAGRGTASGEAGAGCLFLQEHGEASASRCAGNSMPTRRCLPGCGRGVASRRLTVRSTATRSGRRSLPATPRRSSTTARQQHWPGSRPPC